MNELAMKLGRPPQPGVSSATRRVRRRIRTSARRRRFRALRASTTHRRRRRRRHRSTRAPPLTSSSLRTARPGRTARRASTLFPSRPRGPSRRPGVVLVPVRVHRGDIRQPIVLRVTRHRAMSLTVSHPRTRPLSSLFVSRLSRLSPFALVSASSPASHRVIVIPSHRIASHRIASHHARIPRPPRTRPRHSPSSRTRAKTRLGHPRPPPSRRAVLFRASPSVVSRASDARRERRTEHPLLRSPSRFPRAPRARARVSTTSGRAFPPSRPKSARPRRRAPVPRAHAVGRHDPRFHRSRPIGDPPPRASGLDPLATARARTRDDA